MRFRIRVPKVLRAGRCGATSCSVATSGGVVVAGVEVDVWQESLQELDFSDVHFHHTCEINDAHLVRIQIT